MTTTTATHPHPPTPASLPPLEDWSYRAVWRRLPRGLGYLIPTFAIAIAVSALLTSLFSTGVSLLIVVIGLFLIAATLIIARFAGSLEVLRLRWSGERPIVEPDWRFDQSQPLWRKALTPFANGHYWLSLLHGAIIAPVVATISFIFLTLWSSLIVGGLLAPFFWLSGGMRLSVPNALDIAERAGGFGPRFGPWVDRFGELFGDGSMVFGVRLSGVLVVFGIIFAVAALLTLPYLVRAMTFVHAAIARPFLGRFKSEELEGQVSSLFTARSAAVAAEGSALRRIERDIHDGPQQRLIRLQMDLSAAERRIVDSPEEAATLVADARRQAQDALDELRNLSRGFAPPLLLDRGLFAALESLATRSSIPVTLQTTLGSSANLPDEVARNAYFVASELIANAAKHSQATAITLSVTRDEAQLRVAVTDDGVGGAVETAHHGLAGLRDRAVGLGGTFELSSPAGGPTVATVTIPLGGVGAPAESAEPAAADGAPATPAAQASAPENVPPADESPSAPREQGV